MADNNNDTKFTIEGNPGQGNTFINIGTAYNVNPNAKEVNNTFIIGSKEEGEKAMKEATGGINPAPSVEAPQQHSAKPGDMKLGNMTLRDMLENDYIDTANIQKEIMNYVSCIRPYVKKELDKTFMSLWARILDHEAFKIDLYDPGKQECQFNRYLVATIMHYLDNKDFYSKPYNQSEMTRAVEGDADNPVRKGFAKDPEQKYCDVVDAILKDIKDNSTL